MDDFDPRITEAKQFLKLANDADTNNRAEALEDLKFAAGDQWPVEIQNSRNLEARPCLTINKIDAYVRQVTNQQRQQRPRIKVHGMNSQSMTTRLTMRSGVDLATGGLKLITFVKIALTKKSTSNQFTTLLPFTLTQTARYLMVQMPRNA